MNNLYGRLASWVYEIDKPIGKSFGDVEFYRDCLKNIEGPVLEPATGNGRILIPLLEAGIEVDGYDLSQDMLDLCEQALQTRNLKADLSKAAYDSYQAKRQYSALIIPAGSFQLMTDTAEIERAVQNFASSLKPGGKLIVDIYPRLDEEEKPRVRHWQVGDDLLVLSEMPYAIDYFAQKTVSQLRYEHWHKGELVKTELELFSLRWWGVYEFELLLRQAGFKNIKRSADYQYGVEPTDGSSCVTFEAVKG